MSEFRDRALKKLQNEFKTGIFDKYGSLMKTDVLRQLESFCEQDDEFAQAVAQGGTFEDCMKAVAKSCGPALSDLEAYQRAVKFYFPGAKVKMQLTIDLIGDAAGGDPDQAAAKTQQTETKPAGITLDFTQFL